MQDMGQSWPWGPRRETCQDLGPNSLDSWPILGALASLQLISQLYFKPLLGKYSP